MKGVIVVNLTPETRAEINSAIKRVSDSAQKLIDAHKVLAAAGQRAAQDMAKASRALVGPAGRIEQKQRQVSQGRRRFPIPKSHKAR